MNDKVKKDLILLVAVIIGAALCARYFAKGETLEEYAKERTSDTSVTAVSEPDSDIQADIQTEEAKEINMDSPSDDNSNNETSSKNDADVINSAESSSEEQSENSESSTDTVVENFYYEPLSQDVVSRITGISYVENPNVSLDDLRYLSLLSVDFNGDTQKGEMICNKAIAQDLLEIF